MGDLLAHVNFAGFENAFFDLGQILVIIQPGRLNIELTVQCPSTMQDVIMKTRRINQKQAPRTQLYWKRISLGLAFLWLTAVHLAAQTSTEPGRWIPLFNGKNLDGWSPKIRGYELNNNYGNTFRVEEGLLKVSYDQYPNGKFENKFGHIFYKEKYSNYLFRVEYRFVGEQCPDGPGWAIRNSGVMLHCQAPESIRKDQEFPVSIEVQLLGGDGTNPRSTANLCTPGTHVVMGGQLITQHCTSSRSKTYHGNQWVTVELEVRGNELIRHKVNGETVLEYERPQLDESDADARKLIRNGEKMIGGGYISLQSESHPVEFRKVEIMVLD